MIRRLRWKIVAINMAMVTAVLLAVFVGVLVSSRAAVERTVNQRLMQVVQTGRYDASLPGEGSAAPCFVADVYPSGTVRLSGSSYYRLDDQDAMAEIVTACLEQGDSSGILRSYHLRYLRADGPLYTRIAFTDAAQEDATLRAVVKMCLLVGAAALAVLLGCSYLLAGLAARPVARSLDQQRRFLSDASHELKTPLTVILSSADLMQQTAVQPDQQPYVDNIRWSGRRMKRLVEDMLTLSRADDGRLKAAMVPVDLSDAVVDTALRFEPVAFEAGRQLSYDIDEGITVTGSRDQLQQVAGVLLDNAIKYAPQGAGVHMTLTQVERKAVLTVENGGPPIPPEVLPHLFDRFYRADGSRTQGGFGLGLSIAQAIVREHKGTIRCESDRRSTRFIVIRIAGKTGTAQIATGGVYRTSGHQVSFCGYFPADHPKYSCIVVIRRPRIGYPSGGTMSGGVVRAIAEKIYASHMSFDVRDMERDSTAVMVPRVKGGDLRAVEEVLDELDIKADTDSLETKWVVASAEQEENKVKLSDLTIREGLVPRVVGMGAKDAVFLLEQAGLRVSLSGVGRVVSQSIQPGQRVSKGQTVLLTLK